MRRGELLGLQWGDVDLDKATLKVERSLEETKAGLRLKPPAIHDLLLELPRAKSLKHWSERRDLNSRPPVPQTGALTGLRYAPMPR